MRSLGMLRAVAPLLVGALALSACGSSKGSGGTSGGSSGGNKPTYAIAYQGPLSGDNAQLGLNMKYAVELAINQANAKGDLPFKLVYKEADDQGDPGQAPAAAQKLEQDSEVVAIVGPAFSGATKASEPFFTQASLLSVSPSATRVDLTSQGFKTFFRVVPPDNAQGQGAADFLAKYVKAKSVYSIDDKSDYGTGLSSVLEAQLKADGVTVRHESVPPTKDYTGIASKVAGSNTDALYYSGYYNEFALLTKAVKSAGYKGKLMSDDGSNDNKYISLAGASDADGTLLSCACADATVDPKDAAFAAGFKSLANFPAGTYSPESYDATNSIIAAMKELGKNVTRETLVAKYRTIDYPGLTKEIKFQPNGEVAERTIFIYEVKGGKRTLLGTVDKLIK